MKICFLAGANSIHSHRWIKYFSDKEHEISWVSLVPNNFSSLKNVKFYLIKKFFLKPLSILFNIIKIRELINKIKPDIIHSHYAGFYGVLGALSGFHPFLLTAWGSDVLITPKSKIIKPFIKFALKKADLITCDAEHIKEAMVRLGIDHSKIKIINFGIDAEIFCPGQKDDNLIKELGVSGCGIVISLRSLEPIYNIETLIKAIPMVIEEFLETKFIIAGDGSQENKLKELAKSLGVMDNIRFIGRIPNEKLPRYLRIADIYTSTALSDGGIAASTAEAMACGLPVVITNVADNRKWIEDKEDGFIIPPESPEILAEKITILLKDKDMRAKFGERSQKIITERNDYHKEMRKMEKIYYQLLK